ncbi:diguanylate cyclase [Psychrobium sp. nBUS_13]|uniref:sensor domain-containing diguanylate cyclase n=1 Tax=Psychrobium sp. nBUS_13 TaxID=3395319 RepID=UPI003EBE0A7F
MISVLARLFALFLFICWSTLSNANENIRVTIDSSNTVFNYFSSDNRNYSFEQIKQLDKSQWIAADNFAAYGLVDRHYWMRFSVKLTADMIRGPLYLEIANPLVDKIDVHLIIGNEVRHFVAGDKIDVSKRPIATPELYFPLPTANGLTLDVYLRYQDEAASVLPLAITNSKESFEQVSVHGIFIGIIVGIALLLLVTTGAFYRKEKLNIYRYFIGLVLFGTFGILGLEGVASTYIFNALPWLQNLLLPPLFVLTLWCSIQITRELIDHQTQEYSLVHNLLTWLARSIVIIAAILLALPAFVAVLASLIALHVGIVLVALSLILLGIRTKQFQPLLVAAWLAFIISLLIKTTYFSGVLKIPTELFNLATFIYTFQFVLWGAVILCRYIQINEDAFALKSKLLAQSQGDYEELEESLNEYRDEQASMEALFDERTFELNVTLRELQETNRQLEEQATNDALTGGKNRKFFDQRLQAEYRLSRRQNTPLSLLLLDADKFKLVNDNHGHLAGDQVLVEISKIASRILKRPNDYVCRYGGEEFAILLSNTDQKGAEKVAEVIRQRIAETIVKTENIDLQVTVSIGVSTLFIEPETADSQLFEQADQALYFAKASGRNLVKTFQEFESSAKN